MSSGKSQDVGKELGILVGIIFDTGILNKSVEILEMENY